MYLLLLFVSLIEMLRSPAWTPVVCISFNKELPDRVASAISAPLKISAIPDAFSLREPTVCNDKGTFVHLEIFNIFIKFVLQNLQNLTLIQKLAFRSQTDCISFHI